MVGLPGAVERQETPAERFNGQRQTLEDMN